MPVVNMVDEVAADGRVEIPEVDHHAGFSVRCALHAHLQDVVVAVVSRAGAEDLPVAALIPLRTAEYVCGSEGGAACDPHALAGLAGRVLLVATHQGTSSMLKRHPPVPSAPAGTTRICF